MVPSSRKQSEHLVEPSSRGVGFWNETKMPSSNATKTNKSDLPSIASRPRIRLTFHSCESSLRAQSKEAQSALVDVERSQRTDSQPPRSFKIAGRGATRSFRTPSYPGLPAIPAFKRRKGQRGDASSERPVPLPPPIPHKSSNKSQNSPLNPAFLFVVSAICPKPARWLSVPLIPQNSATKRQYVLVFLSPFVFDPPDINIDLVGEQALAVWKEVRRAPSLARRSRFGVEI